MPIFLTSCIFPWQEWIDANQWIHPLSVWLFILTIGTVLSLAFRNRLVFLLSLPIIVTFYLRWLSFLQAIIAIAFVTFIAFFPYKSMKGLSKNNSEEK